MRNRNMVVLAVLVVAFAVATASSMNAEAKDRGLDEVIGIIQAGGGNVYFSPEPAQGAPVNFQDFPDAFEPGSALVTWDMDMIDVEKVDPAISGAGVYVAILDTGLKRNYRDYFPEERIAKKLGRSFIDNGIMRAYKSGEYVPNVVESKSFTAEHPHGTHVTSTVIGYSFNGTPIQGVAPEATIIPVKVLNTYEGLGLTFGTDYAVAAGINYIGDLAAANPDSRFVINMSLGSLSEISEVEAEAIDYAIAEGVVIVAAAGNKGTDGMDSPGSYAPVISVGATGWAFNYFGFCNGEWILPDCSIQGSWWYAADVPEDLSDLVSYITDFSGRVEPALGWPQELDVVAPGSWVVGPYPVGPGQSHLPWWSNGEGNGVGGQYFFLGGTSMATPHVAGVAALMLQADPGLSPSAVESFLRNTADPIPFSGTRDVVDPNLGELVSVPWGDDSDGLDAVGYGLVQADAAVEAVTP
jgi:subtilisin family serine protease